MQLDVNYHETRQDDASIKGTQLIKGSEMLCRWASAQELGRPNRGGPSQCPAPQSVGGDFVGLDLESLCQLLDRRLTRFNLATLDAGDLLGTHAREVVPGKATQQAQPA